MKLKNVFTDKVSETLSRVKARLTLKAVLKAAAIACIMAIILLIGALIPEIVIKALESSYIDYGEALILEDIKPLSYREQAQQDATERRIEIASMLRYNAASTLTSYSVPYSEGKELEAICNKQLENIEKYGLLPSRGTLSFNFRSAKKLYAEDIRDSGNYFVGWAFRLSTDLVQELYMVILRDEATPAHIVAAFKDPQESAQPYTAAVSYCKYLGIWDESRATVTVLNDNYCEIAFNSLTISVQCHSYGSVFGLSAYGESAICIEDYLYNEYYDEWENGG